MNKIYRKVWNKALGRIVVASELASSDGGGTTVGAVGTSRGTAHATLVAAVALALASMGAHAQDQNVDVGPTGSVTAGQTVLDNDGIRIGNTVAIGANAVTVSNGADSASLSAQGLDVGSVLVRGTAVTVGTTRLDTTGLTATSGATTTVVNGTRMGVSNGAASSNLTSNGLAVTNGAATTNVTATGMRITNGPSVTTTGINAGGLKVTGVADGSIAANSKEAVNGGQIYTLRDELYTVGAGVKYFHANSTAPDSIANGGQSVAIGPNSVSDGFHSIAAGDGATTALNGEAAIAVGRLATTAAARSIALGDRANAGNLNVQDTIAIGTTAAVTGDFSLKGIAIGHAATVSAVDGVALGAGTTASGAGAAAVGANSVAGGAESVAVGRATATGARALAAGSGATVATADSIALGTGAGVGTAGNAAGDRTSHIAIGTGAGTGVIGNQTTAIGFQAGTGVEGDQNIAIGTQAGNAAEGDYNVALGYQANSTASERDRTVAIGGLSTAATDATSLGYGAKAEGVASVSIGSQSRASESGVALGRNARADKETVALGFNSAALESDALGSAYLTGDVAPSSVVSVGNTVAGQTRRIVNVAAGANATDAVNVKQLQSAQNSVANLIGGDVSLNSNGSFSPIKVGNNTYNTVTEALSAVSSGATTALPPEAVTRVNGRINNIAAGQVASDAVNVQQLNETVEANSSKYVSVRSTAVGNRSNDGAIGENAVAIGALTDSAGDGATAAGYQAHAIGAGSVAMGRNVSAEGASSSVIGDNSYAKDEGGVAIGRGARSTGVNSVVMGTRAQADPKAGSTVNDAIVIGTDAEVTANDGVAIGHSALASAVRGVAQGFEAQATGVDSIAQGSNALASGVSAQASGTQSVASGQNAQARGTTAQASGTDAIANGTNSRGYASNAVAIGTGAVAGIASPRPEDLVNNTNATAIGNGALANQRNTTAMGPSASATARSAMALGDSASATAVQSSAVGTRAAASGTSAFAAGTDADASGTSAIAVGTTSVASGADSVAVGSTSQATGNRAFAGGFDAQATGADAYALGRGSRASGIDSIAFGRDAQASFNDSVALGHNSVTAAAVGTPNATVDNVTYSYAGTQPGSTVSVGTDTIKRTLTNVAAGRVSGSSTDAINGSQLFGTNQAVTALGNNLDSAGSSIASGLGGNSFYNAGTHQVVTRLQLGNTTYSNAQDALTRAASGINLTAQGANSTNVGPTSTVGATMDLRSVNSNIGVSKAANTNTVEFALANNLDLGTNGSVKTGNTLVDNAGVAVTNGVESTRITAGNVAVGSGANITNVGPTSVIVGGANPLRVDGSTGNVTGLSNKSFTPGSITSGRAATEDQLQLVSNVANAGWNVTDANGNAANIGPDGKVTFTGDNNLTVAQTGADDAGVVGIALKKQIDLGTAGSVTTGNTQVNNNGVVVNDGVSSSSIGAGNIAVSDVNGTTAIGSTSITVGGNRPVVINGANGTVNGLTNKSFDPTKFTSGQAASEDQLAVVSQTVSAGWNISADGQNASKVSATSPTGSNVDLRSADDNLVVTKATNSNDVEFALAKEIDLSATGSVTTGNTVVDNAGVAVNDGTSSTTVTAGNVAVSDGTYTTAVGATSINVGGANPLVISGATGTIGGLKNTSFDPTKFTSGQAASEDQLKQVSDVASAGWNVTDAKGNLANIGPNGVVTFTGDSNLDVAQSGAQDAGVVGITLKKNLNLGTTGSVAAGNTTVNTTGVTVDDGTASTQVATTGLTTTDGTSSTVVTAGQVGVSDGTNATAIGATQISVGGLKPLLINGATGTIGGLTNTSFDPTQFTSGQAASEDQLKQVSDVASAGWNISAEGANSSNVGPNSATGSSVDLRSADGNVVVTKATNSNDVEFALAKKIDLSATGSVTTGNTVVDNAGVAVNDGTSSTAVTAGNVAISDGTYTTAVGATSINVGGANPLVISGATGTIGGLKNTSFDPNKFTSGQAASEDQLKQVSDVASAGWNVTAEGANGSNVAVGSATGNNVDLRSSDSNIVVSKSATSNDVEFALADDLAVAGSVTVGNTRIDTTGLTIVGGPSITSAGIDAGSTRITNVATGVDGTDAVNVDQLDDTIEARRTRYYSVNSTGGGNEANDGATGADAIASGRDAEADGDQAVAMGVGAQAAGNGSVALGAGARAQAVNSLAFGNGAVASHGNSIAMGAGSATTVGAQANYQGAYVGNSSSSGEMNLGGRQVTGVAAGSAATDAVNVSQLTAGVASAVSDSNQYTDTQISTVNTRIDGIDNRVTNVEGDIIDIRGDITDIRNDVVDIQGDITNLDGRVNTMERDLNNANMVAGNTAAKVTNMEYGADGMFQVSQDGDLNKPQVTGQNAVGGGKGAVASGNNSTALGNQAVASGANSTAIGQGAVASHDNSVALGQGSKTTVGAQTGYNAAYVGTSSSTGEVNIGGRTMTGVAAGIAGTDATNVNQLTAGVNQAITSANQYTDNRIGKVEDDLWQLDRGYRSATAAAMAMAGLPQAYLPGKSMLSMAFGGYQSEYGMALGLSGITDNGRWVYKAQASGNTMRDWGFSVGAGLQW